VLRQQYYFNFLIFSLLPRYLDSQKFIIKEIEPDYLIIEYSHV